MKYLHSDGQIARGIGLVRDRGQNNVMNQFLWEGHDLVMVLLHLGCRG